MSQQPHEPDQEPTGATQQQCQRPLHSLLHGPGGAVPQQPGQAVRPQRDGLPALPPQWHGEGPAGGAVPHHRLPGRLAGQHHAGPEDPQPPRRRPPQQAERHGGHAARPPEQRALPPVQQVPRGPRGGGLRPRHLGQGRLPEEEDGLPAPGEVQAAHRAAGPGLLGGGLGAHARRPTVSGSGGSRTVAPAAASPNAVPSAGRPRGPPAWPAPPGEDCAETQQHQNSRRQGLDPASSGDPAGPWV
ncbi:PREDICTED: leukemia inhibitory factor [Myotis davidii]|uniref:leukemia inhibitory factor n=1 Tax=Myotis davidii TaxID=225400 RepID=UPI0003EBC5AE|nr:PREDICTED: leukemia inhibitory factor [Myotis davidii]